jgi:tRNA1Val (adenine37-N6)-methyltransferase
MGNSPFRFKQFEIHHDKCSMKVGTDGVLLGAWCTVEGAGKVLDIGTGSGLIAIMLAQRNGACLIDAVEIDRDCCLQASENIAACPWHSRINLHNEPFQEFYNKYTHSYDLIVTNPPYFQNSLASPDPKRSSARHSCTLSMDVLIAGVSLLLAPGGIYSMIMPVQEAMIFIEKAREKRLFCRRITSVIPNPGKPPKRLLLEFGFREEDIQRSSLVTEIERHEYSSEYKKLTEDFYLYFLR